MPTTLFELKEKMATMSASIAADAAWIAEKAADAATPMSEIEAKKTHREELRARYELLKEEHDAMEETQRGELAIKVANHTGPAEKEVIIKGKAAFYRATALKDKDAIEKAYQGLGAIPANSSDLGGGSNLLPTNLSREIITEPYEENSLRLVEPTTQIAGLEEPRIAFAIDDEDLLEDVVDAETAKEIAASADVVTYGRYKTKLTIQVADTVIFGSDADVVAEVENSLRSQLARKEKLRAFAQSADDDHKHMSFYMVGIKGVTGNTVVNAIMKALGDLPDLFRANAKVVMRAADWYDYIQTLVNNSDTLFTAKPQDIIGVPVTFNDRAVIPIVGDFRYSKQNYDPMATLDSDKDIKTGMYIFVLTAWGDHQIKLKSAFRLAITGVALIGGVAKTDTPEQLAGEDITVTPTFNTDDGNKPTAGVTYLWQSKQADVWTDLTNSYVGYNTNKLTTVEGADEGVSFRCGITYGGVTKYTNIVKMAE